jgi:SpoVK/Ycf46/Vps4 family AAA+-type ATPase
MQSQIIKNYENITNNKIISKKESFFQYLFVQSILNKTKIKRINNKSFITELNNKFKQNNLKYNLNNNLPIIQETKINSISNRIKLSDYLDIISSHDKNKLHLSDYSKNNSNLLKESILSQNKIFINYKKPFLSYWLLPFLGLIGLVPTCMVQPLSDACKLEEDHAGRLSSSTVQLQDLNKNSQILLKNDISKDSCLFSTDKDSSINYYFQITNLAACMDGLPAWSDCQSATMQLPVSDHATAVADKFVKYKEIMDELFLASLEINKKNSETKNLNFDFSKLSLAILNLRHSCNFNWCWSNLNMYLNKNLISSKNFPIYSDFENKTGIVFPRKLLPTGTSKNFILDIKTDKISSFRKKTTSTMPFKKYVTFLKNNKTSNTNSIKNLNLIFPNAAAWMVGLPAWSDCLHGRQRPCSCQSATMQLPVSDHPAAGEFSLQTIQAEQETTMQASRQYFVGIINDKTNKYLKKKKLVLTASQGDLINTKFNLTPYKSIKKALLLMDEIILNGPEKRFAACMKESSTLQLSDSILVKNVNNNVVKVNPILSFILNDIKGGLTIDNIENNFLNNNSFNIKNDKKNEFLEKIIHIVFKNNEFLSKDILNKTFANKSRSNLSNTYEITGYLNSDSSIQTSNCGVLSLKGLDHAATDSSGNNIFFRKDVLYNSIFEGLKDSLNTILINFENNDPNVQAQQLPGLISKEIRLSTQAYTIQESLFKDNLNKLKKVMPLSQHFSSESNYFTKNKNIILRPFYLIPTNQDSFKILKLNHPIRGGSRISQEFKSFGAASACMVGLPAWSAAEVFSMQLPVSDHAAAESIMQKDENVKNSKDLFDFFISSPANISRKFSSSSIVFPKGVDHTDSNNLNNKAPIDPGAIGSQMNIKNITNKTMLSPISIRKISEFNFTNKNSFLFLNKYINLLSMNIKKSLTPYKFRLTYFPELNINKKALKHFIIKEKVPSGTQAEKIFLSYLSKVKKPYNSNSLKDKPRIVDTNHRVTSHFNFKDLKLKSKLFLKKNIYSSKLLKYKINLIKQKNVESRIMVATNKSGIESFISESKNRHKNIYAATLNTSNLRIFLSKKINFLKLNQLAGSQVSKPIERLPTWSDCQSVTMQLPVSVVLEPETIMKINQINNKNKISQVNHSNKVTLSNKLIDVLSKKQTLKIKRRLKKMKKETRRRKKRKIFYPRPKWITFSLYRNFLNNRYQFESSNLDSLKKKSSYFSLQAAAWKRLPLTGSCMVADWQSDHAGSPSMQADSFRKQKIWKPSIGSDNGATGLLKKQVRLNEGQTKDFYRTSSTVFFDLKRILMKSNWLRNYLNPYFDKVKNIYQEVQTSSKKLEIYLRIRDFLINFYGFDSDFSSCRVFPKEEDPDWQSCIAGLPAWSDCQSATMQLPVSGSLFHAAAGSPFLYHVGRANNQNQKISKEMQYSFENPNIRNNSFSEKIQNRFNIIEYNRIIYQRFQRIILSIKDNLNLNGEIKNRSKKLGKNIRPFIKRDYKSNGSLPNQSVNTNQKSSFWSKFIKNMVLKINTYTSYGYNGLSNTNTILNVPKNNLFWALNKTNIPTSGTIENYYNFPKKLWENYKIREVSKSNKTKKIIYNLFNKYGLNNLGGSNSSKSLEGLNHVLEEMYKNNIQNITKISQISDEGTKPPIQAGRILSDQNQVIGENLVPLISLNNYIFKSEQKLTAIENKLKLLGLYSKRIEKTYKNSYFRSLKQQLVNSSYTKKIRISPSIGGSSRMVLSQKGSTMQAVSESPNTISLEKIVKNSKDFENNNINSFSSLNNYHKISNNYSYWWASSPLQIKYLSNILPAWSVAEVFSMQLPAFKNDETSNFLSTKQNFNKQPMTKASGYLKLELFSSEIMFSLLFHFCTLVSFISLGGIRTLIKFYYILISKTSKLITQISFIELFRPSIFLNNFNENNKNLSNKSFKNNPQLSGAINQIKKENKFIQGTAYMAKPLAYRHPLEEDHADANLSSSPPTQLRLLFFQYIIARNQITKLKKYQDKFNTNKIFKITDYPDGIKQNLNKGWTTSKIKKSKILDSTWILGTPDWQSCMVGLPAWSDCLHGRSLKGIRPCSWMVAADHPGSCQSAEVFSMQLEDFPVPGLNQVKQSSFMLVLNKSKFNLISLVLFKTSTFFYSFYKTKFYINFFLLKSIDLFALPISFIYKFFEKPGEYVVENLAYNFLVEWSSDLITTIPDTFDMNSYSYISKFNRNITPLILFYTTFGYTLSSFLNQQKKKIYLDSFLWAIPLAISNSILKRLLNSTLLIFIQQLYEPDIDSIIREKKGIIFWDLWGESLKQIAEENSINIYELTTDKEEQIKLLSKYAAKDTSLGDGLSYSNHSEVNNKTISAIPGGVSLLTQTSIYKTNFIKLSKDNTVSKKIKSLKLLGNYLTSLNLVSSAKWSGATNQLLNNPYKIIDIAISNGERNIKAYNNNFGWSASQFLSYQGKDTDLFIDLHPPKSFWSIPSIKYAYSIQQPIGSIVCQIFSGIFYKQISKNILIVGSASLEKSILIQAMAGETELKMITDNANRYAMVYRGVAVGIKLLRDVFEALSVHTPCIFLMEDIHIIGERRPFLIDEASSSDDAAYNKNQSMQGILLKEKSSGSDGAREVLYRSTKHLLSHYKKPYKEPKSLATNHFSFTFLFSNSPSRKRIKTRDNFFKPGGAALPIQVIKKENESKYKITNSNITKNNKQNNYFFGSLDPFHIFSDEKNLNGNDLNDIIGSDGLQKKIKYSSALELKTDNSQSLSPPSSSPFNVLVLKEEKKFKHKKLIKEIPWFGLPGEQFSLIFKHNYSTRIKIALLADLILSNLSVKLDMITDLLVIIDSVKGNRGFVVFATTHIPSILDPALRRPGRFDETINLPLVSTLFSRWSNYRYNIKFLSSYLYQKADYCFDAPLASTFNKGVTLDLFKSNLIIYDKNILNQSSNELINYINKKNSIFNKKLSLHAAGRLPSPSIQAAAWKRLPLTGSCMVLSLSGIYHAGSPTMQAASFGGRLPSGRGLTMQLQSVSQDAAASILSKQSFRKIHDQNQLISNKQFIQLKARNYSFACKSLISLLLFSSNSSLKWISILKDSNIFLEDYSLYLTMFGNPLMLKIVLMSMIGGKIGESFVFHSLKREKGSSLRSKTRIIENQIESIDSNLKNMQSINTVYKIENEFLFDFDNTWRQASSLLLNYLQKRQCAILNKNTALCGYSKGINQLLSFNNKYSLMEPPSPPITNILLPAKRYEYYKKTFNNQYETNISNKQNSFSGSLLEKLQFHQQQRLLKRLYKYPIKEFFKSEILTNSNQLFKENQLNYSSENNNHSSLQAAAWKRLQRLPLTGSCMEKTSADCQSDHAGSPTMQAGAKKQTNFNSSYLTLAPLEKMNGSKNLINLSKISSSNWCYKNILYNRHRTYLTNQWWNGQQGEHNAESTFLSDIDWRYTFVQSVGDINIDFPDAEQYYNPRNRRWFINSQGDNDKWTYWFNIQSDFKDIYSHYIYECFTKVFKFLNENREIIDFYAEMLHQIPSTPSSSTETGLNERELLNIYKRFYASNS